MKPKTCWICGHPIGANDGEVEQTDAQGTIMMHWSCHFRGTSVRLISCPPAQMASDAYNHSIVSVTMDAVPLGGNVSVVDKIADHLAQHFDCPVVVNESHGASLNESDLPQLNELDKDEWRDVYFLFRPNDTQDDYDAAWADFQRFKAAYLARKSQQ